VLAQTTNPETVSRLLTGFQRGEPGAAGQLVEILYPELRRLAAARMKAEKPGHTWQPTALVNELFLELLRIRALPQAESREAGKADFMAFAAHLMKRLLIHHARPLSRRVEKVGVEGTLELAQKGSDRPDTMAEIESLLDGLEKIDPRIRAVVELRVFGGLTGAEIAETLGCGTATVTRCWSFGQQWLRREIGGAGNP
jgi:RNA polymerase sigma factor (TIGR02999 family)